MRTGLVAAAAAALIALGCAGEPPPEVPPAPLPPLEPLASTKPAGTAAERVAEAEAHAGAGDLAAAIRELESALLIDAKDRAALRLLARYGLERSKAIAATEPGEAYRTIVSAGGYYRTLRETYPDATDEEKALGLDLLYAEASAHARSLRMEEAEGALRDAVGAGFRDFARLEADPDWAAMLALAQFRPSYDAIKAAAGP